MLCVVPSKAVVLVAVAAACNLGRCVLGSTNQNCYLTLYTDSKCATPVDGSTSSEASGMCFRDSDKTLFNFLKWTCNATQFEITHWDTAKCDEFQTAPGVSLAVQRCVRVHATKYIKATLANPTGPADSALSGACKSKQAEFEAKVHVFNAISYTMFGVTVLALLVLRFAGKLKTPFVYFAFAAIEIVIGVVLLSACQPKDFSLSTQEQDGSITHCTAEKNWTFYTYPVIFLLSASAWIATGVHGSCKKQEHEQYEDPGKYYANN